MMPFSTIAKRLLLACSLVLVTACGSNGITDPTSEASAKRAKKSGYLTVSAAVVSAPAPTTTTLSRPRTAGKQTMVQSGYNVPAQ
jgi:hypothetical protein